MVFFHSLPDLLVRKILHFVRPEDLENFAQLSRHVFWLAAPFLVQHRALIRRYNTLRNNTRPGSIKNLLRTILTYPRIASYVKKIELGRLVESTPGLDQANAYTKRELEIFTTAAVDSECLNRSWGKENSDKRELWSNHIQDGNEAILLAILLPLLPNLATLLVEANSTKLLWYDSVIEQAASATNPTLCKLTHVWLNPRGGDGYHVDEIQRFCALPSVRVLTAPKAFGVDYLHQFIPHENSNVTALRLSQSSIDSESLYEFLRGFPKLQSFTYSCLDATNGASHDAFLIRSGLLAHCKTTLRSLILLAPGGGDMHFMGSLRGFEALKKIHTQWSFLIPECPDPWDPDIRGPQLWWLNEHLPASLLWLKMHDNKGRDYSRYEKVIESAQYASNRRLQKLKLVIFVGQFGWSRTADRRLKKMLSDKGITFIFFRYSTLLNVGD